VIYYPHTTTYIMERHDSPDSAPVRHRIRVSRVSHGPDAPFEDPVRALRIARVVVKDGNPAMEPVLDSVILGDNVITVHPYSDDLTSLIKPADGSSRDTGVLHGVFLELLYAVCYLHDHLRVAHLGLSADKVLLDQDRRVRIGDWMCATPVPNASITRCRSLWQEQLTEMTSRLHASGQDAAKVRQQVDQARASREQLYSQLTTMSGLVKDVVQAPCDRVDARVASVPPLQVPMLRFFLARSPREGYTGAVLAAVSDYVDPVEPHMTGPALMQSYSDYIRTGFPGVAAQKARVGESKATLQPDLAPRFYSESLPDSHVVPTEAIRGKCGHPQYMCPQMLVGGSTLPLAADVYALGVILFLCATGVLPAELGDRGEARLVEGGARALLREFELDRGLSEECVELIHEMMDPRPERRPSVKGCVERFKNMSINNTE
jgi:serine/threonine protein kinase